MDVRVVPSPQILYEGLSSLLVGSSRSPASSCWKLLLLWLSPQRWSSCHLFTRHLPGRNEFYNPSQKHWAKEWLSQLPSATPRPTVYHGSPNETSRDRNGLKDHHSPRFDPSLSPRRGCYESSPPHPETVKHRENYSQVQGEGIYREKKRNVFTVRLNMVLPMKLVECRYKHHVVQLFVSRRLQSSSSGWQATEGPTRFTQKCERLFTKKVYKGRILCHPNIYTLFLDSSCFSEPCFNDTTCPKHGTCLNLKTSSLSASNIL